MPRRRTNRVVQALRQHVVEGEFLYTEHSRLEMEDESVAHEDVVAAIRHGRLKARQTHGERGVRYLMEGDDREGRPIRVVCSFKANIARIITVFRV